MILVDKFNQRKEMNKLLREGRNVGSLNIPIDLMNVDELSQELTYVSYKYRDADELDTRTIELLKESFTYAENMGSRIKICS